MPSRREQRSLFGEILDWMLAPLLLVWPMSVALTWLVAQGIANRPYDRDLESMARALAQAVVAEQQADMTLPSDASLRVMRAATAILRGDQEDQLHYQVLGARGELLAGSGDLPVPPEDAPIDGEVRFRDDRLRDDPVRVAYVWLPIGAPGSDRSAAVQVAETLGRRSQLATEIIKGVILPQFVILPLAVVLVWFALSRGIQPLSELQGRIRRRDPGDLSPLEERDVPEEVAPLVSAINDLLLRLDQSMASQRHFLADAAHQLKTPLAGLRMQAELAARQIERGETGPQEMRRTLQQIALSSQRAAHMVNQLLSMARADDEAGVLRMETLDLVALTTEVVRDFVPKALDKRIDLGFEAPTDGRPAMMTGHPVLISELVRNLVDNALQYTPAGGTVTVRVGRETAQDGHALLLEVEDTGPGIAPSEREQVFRPFYRALGTEVDGSGLGLAIVQEIAQRHRAQVTISDAHPWAPPRGPGARFTVRFALQGE